MQSRKPASNVLQRRNPTNRSERDAKDKWRRRNSRPCWDRSISGPAGVWLQTLTQSLHGSLSWLTDSFSLLVDVFCFLFINYSPILICLIWHCQHKWLVSLLNFRIPSVLVNMFAITFNIKICVSLFFSFVDVIFQTIVLVKNCFVVVISIKKGDLLLLKWSKRSFWNAAILLCKLGKHHLRFHFALLQSLMLFF